MDKNKLHFLHKHTDYGAYREILKDGNMIVGWVEQYPHSTLPESDKWFYAFGKPSQTSFMAFQCDTLEEAKTKLIEYC